MTHAGDPYRAGVVRGSLLAFLAGRGFSAVLTFTAFTLAARVLPLEEYGIYMVALATLETALPFATGGLNWVIARMLPEYRVHGDGRATVHVVLCLGLLQIALYTAIAFLFYAGAEFYASVLRLEHSGPALRRVSGLLLLEGTGRLFRDQILGALMRQGAGQLGQVVRSGVLVVLLGRDILVQHQISAVEMIWYESLAAAGGMVVGGSLLVWELWRVYRLPSRVSTWSSPPVKQLVHLAVHMYLNHLLALARSTEILILILTRMLGSEAAAVFGFGNGFADRVRRYLPTELLQSVLQPALFAFYSRTGDFSALMLRLFLWFKSSLIVLLPVIVYFAAFGEHATEILGGSQFRQAWFVVVLLLLGTGVSGLRKIAELASNAVMASAVCVRAGIWLLGVPPATIGLLLLGGGLPSVVLLIVLAETFYGWRVLAGLRNRGHVAHMNWWSFARLVFFGGVAGAVLRWVFQPFPFDGTISVVACLMASSIAILAARPISQEESGVVAGWGVNGVRQVTRLLAR
ncbi:MAG TPA: oligosaccharide flippase family protein [Methylococcus sp.]|nr:oligosaccharide flippase family protein [Methylococcus sp.]